MPNGERRGRPWRVVVPGERSGSFATYPAAEAYARDAGVRTGEPIDIVRDGEVFATIVSMEAAHRRRP